jgi:hypothetical protein
MWKVNLTGAYFMTVKSHKVAIIKTKKIFASSAPFAFNKFFTAKTAKYAKQGL